jgi:hypothetical protein
MKSQFIIIAILIMIKVIGVASRVKADEIYLACSSEAEIQLINNFNNPTYRCGNSPELIRI